MRSLIFTAGDVGGARALLPIIALAAARGQATRVIRHGALVAEPHVAGEWIDAGDVSFTDPAHRPLALVFAGSVADAVPLQFARRADAAGVPTIFVLDSWSSYASRLTTDGLAPFLPSVYCVPDHKAEACARRDGVTAPIVVTGQPAFADAVGESRSVQIQARAGVKVLLVSEPAEADHGRSRGYTETEVMTMIAAALQNLAPPIHIDILPHPRDDAAKITSLWTSVKGNLDGEILRQNSLKSVADYDAVIGMASVLLYRAWLLGLPVLSCQPGLILDPLRQFGERDGIILVDKVEGATHKIHAWAETLVQGQNLALRPEAFTHAKAAETILQVATESGMRALNVQ